MKLQNYLVVIHKHKEEIDMLEIINVITLTFVYNGFISITWLSKLLSSDIRNLEVVKVFVPNLFTHTKRLLDFNILLMYMKSNNKSSEVI